jgi:hypothetical protein
MTDRSGIGPADLSGHDAVHCDYQPANLLTSHGRITGVIDWEGAGCSDRRFDLVTLRFGVHAITADPQATDRLDRLLDDLPPDVLAPMWAHMSLCMTDWAIRHFTPSGAGFKYQLQFQVVPRTGQPLYLVFGTGHEKGVQVMKDAMWDVDGSQGMHFRDPRTRGAVGPGQQTIWQGFGFADPELLELVRQRLASGRASLEELGQWLLLETARWRARDAKVAIKDLQNDGAISIQPPGRLLRASVISLC